MKCNIGDKIRFLNDVGGGTIVGFVNQSTVLVRDDDGFEIPTLISEIIVVNDDSDKQYQNRTRQSSRVEAVNKEVKSSKNYFPEEKIEPKTPKKYIPKDEDGSDFSVALGFLPTDAAKPTESDIRLYIINDSSYRIFYTLGLWHENTKIEPLSSGELEGDCKDFAYLLKRSELSASQILHVSFVLFKNREYLPQSAQEIDYEINPVKFFKKGVFAENDFFDNDAFIYILASSAKTLKDYVADISPREIAHAMKEKKDLSPKRPKIKQNTDIEEVDLHIEALTDNHEGMSNGDMLQMQIDRFTTALDLGITSGTKRMVFIHGVGNGKLKHEVCRLLDTQYAGKVRYQDASFKEYGYGATMVYIK